MHQDSCLFMWVLGMESSSSCLCSKHLADLNSSPAFKRHSVTFCFDPFPFVELGDLEYGGRQRVYYSKVVFCCSGDPTVPRKPFMISPHPLHSSAGGICSLKACLRDDHRSSISWHRLPQGGYSGLGVVTERVTLYRE